MVIVVKTPVRTPEAWHGIAVYDYVICKDEAHLQAALRALNESRSTLISVTQSLDGNYRVFYAKVGR